MKKLNYIYENNELFYYCNSCGEINIPGTDMLSLHKADELPVRERELYENYWDDSTCGRMYVVNYKGNPAMALSFIFDEYYLSDILNKTNISKKDMDKWYKYIFNYAQILAKNKIVSGCEICIGEYTDSDGHELVVIIPYEKRKDINNIASFLNETVYLSVEELM